MAAARGQRGMKALAEQKRRAILHQTKIPNSRAGAPFMAKCRQEARQMAIRVLALEVIMRQERQQDESLAGDACEATWVIGTTARIRPAT